MWIQAWFDLTDRTWMRVWVDRLPHREPLRDRLADIVGIIPAGTTRIFDRVHCDGGWKRRPLGEAWEVAHAIQMELMEAAVQTYINRCEDMSAWWSSKDALPHREDRTNDLGRRRYNASRKRSAASLAKWIASRETASRKRARRDNRPPPDPNSVASRLSNRKRTQFVPRDPLVLLEDKLPEEYEAEAAQERTLKRRCAPDLPWF